MLHTVVFNVSNVEMCLFLNRSIYVMLAFSSTAFRLLYFPSQKNFVSVKRVHLTSGCVVVAVVELLLTRVIVDVLASLC